MHPRIRLEEKQYSKFHHPTRIGRLFNGNVWIITTLPVKLIIMVKKEIITVTTTIALCIHVRYIQVYIIASLCSLQLVHCVPVVSNCLI